MIQRLVQFYEHENSNVHRAAHTLAARSTNALEGAREKVQRFLGANSAREIVFVRGTTEGINLVAQTYGRQNVHQDDEIILTELEHHSNIVPWQHLAREKGARIRVAPIDDRGEIILSEYEKLFSSATKLVCVSQVSNALGTVVPVKTMIEVAQRHGVAVLVDGAQSVGHMPVNVQALGCDFFIFSGHKLFAPTGIGAVWAKAEHLEEMPPWQGGGNMIDQVTFDATTYADIPAKFEAGTGIIGGAVGLGAAIDYLGRIGFESALRYEHELLAYAHEALRSISGLRIIGQAAEKAGVISFVLDGMRSEDVGPLLDNEGIAVRAGHHCAQPALRHFGLTSTVRPSLAFYNTRDEIDRLVEAVHKIKSIRS